MHVRIGIIGAGSIGATPVSVVDAANVGELVVIAIPTKAVVELPRGLFGALMSGEHALRGFTNRDLRDKLTLAGLCPRGQDPALQTLARHHLRLPGDERSAPHSKPGIPTLYADAA
jgi:hypothetical protein